MPRFAVLYCKVAPAPYEGPIGIPYKKPCPVEIFLVSGLEMTTKTNIGLENPNEVKYINAQDKQATEGAQRLLINNYVTDSSCVSGLKPAECDTKTEVTAVTETVNSDKGKKKGIFKSLGKRLRRLGRNIIGKQKNGQ